MADGEGGEGQPTQTTFIASSAWTPESGLATVRTPHEEHLRRVMKETGYQVVTLNNFKDNLKPRAKELLFSGKILTDSEKIEYQYLLRESVFGALAVAFKDNEKLNNIYSELYEAKNRNPEETSLFSEIQTRLELLAGDTQDFEVNGQKLTQEEIEHAIEGLKYARDEILVEAAKSAEVFEHWDPDSNEPRGINAQIRKAQDNPNFERAIKNVYALNDRPDQLYAEETYRINRSSPDFWGMSSMYVDNAADIMEFHLHQAESEYYAQAASNSSNPQEVQEYTNLAEMADSIATKLKTRLDIVSWGKGWVRTDLKERSWKYINKREKGEVFEEEETRGVRSSMVGEDAWKKVLESIQQLTSVEASRLDYDRMNYEALHSSYKAVLHGIRTRGYIRPEQFDQLLPPWYRELSPKEQGIIRAELAMNIWAALKRDSGAVSTEAWATTQGIRIRAEDVNNMWRELPGFRQAMATMSRDLFENKEYFEGHPERGPVHFVLSDNGYDLLSDTKKFDEYKDQLISELEEYLDNKLSDEDKNRFKKDYGISFREAAERAVVDVDNLFFASGVYDSADEKRQFVAVQERQQDGTYTDKLDGKGNPIYSYKPQKEIHSTDHKSDAVWALFVPGQKAKEKWFSPSDEGTGKTPIAWGGDFGYWMMDNIQHNREVAPGVGFADILMSRDYEIDGLAGLSPEQKESLKEIKNYMPERMAYDMLTHTSMLDGSETLGQLLITKEKAANLTYTNEQGQEVTLDIVDYVGGDGAIDLSKTKADEWRGSYLDPLTKVLDEHKHLTGGDRDRMTISKHADAWSKLRGDPLYRELYTKKGYMKTALGLSISLQGFEQGQPKLKLAIPEDAYNAIVTSALMDARLYVGLPNGGLMKQQLIDAYDAKDVTKVWNLLFDIYIEGTWFAPRERRSRRWGRKTTQEVEAFEEEQQRRENARRRQAQLTQTQNP